MARGNFLKLLVALVVVTWTVFLSLTNLKPASASDGSNLAAYLAQTLSVQASELKPDSESDGPSPRDYTAETINGHGSKDIDTSTSEPHTLKDFVELYKGVDSSPSAENTVLFALTTKEGVNFTLNWACWCSGLNLSYFIWATDEEAYRSLTDRGLPTYFDANASSSANEQNIRYDLNPEKRVWNRAGFEKMYAVLSILELGYDVFLSDIDVVILKNPWPHFARDADLEYQVEVLYSEIEIPEDIQINVGWFLAKSNAKTLDVFKKTLASNRHESTVEQNVVNGITRAKLREKSAVFLNYTEPRREEPPAEDMLVLRMMPMLEYPAGGIVFHGIRRDRYLERIANGLDPVMVHFNLIKGLDLKEKCAHDKGYWRHNWTSNTCDSSYEIDYTNKRGCQAS